MCLETKSEWEDLVNKRLKLISRKTTPVTFIPTHDIRDVRNIKNKNNFFDMIFVDGESGFARNRNLRLDFALLSWDMLKENGEMLFHDTRRQDYLKKMTDLIVTKINEIERIDLNVVASNGVSSNISSVRKKKKTSNFVDLQSIEDYREEWTFGSSKHQEFIEKNGLYTFNR